MEMFLELLRELADLCRDLARYVRDWRERWKRS